MEATIDERLLAWTRAVLVAETLPVVAELLVQGPALPGDDLTGVLVLADPAHELRTLAFGQGDETDARGAQAAVLFVDGLVGVAPECTTLHAPWSGAYRAADHGLLLPPGSGVQHLLLLPLERDPHLLGLYCLGARGRPPALAELSPAWQSHVAATVLATLERHFHRARLLRIGMTDPVTGWHTRRYLHSRLCEELARCRRDDAPASCLLVDVDHLRHVNERHGATAGDRVLRELAVRLEAQVRSSDTFAHLGGDQFAVLLPGASASQAVPLAERILTAVRAAPIELAPSLSESVTVSIGIAAAQPGGPDDRKAAADQWLAEAEAALHRAKRRGGDGHAISSVAAT